MNIIWDGYSLEQFQRCKRPIAISRTHQLARWRPQSLLAACLRKAIFGLSNGEDKVVLTSTAITDFLSLAKSPGLDVEGVDTYSLSQDYTAIIRNIVEYLSRTTLLCLRRVPHCKLTDNILWRFLSYQDETGTLHRWIFEDFISEDITSHLHSWEVFGDIAAADAPMILHIVAIGRRVSNHQSSHWCRVYAHPKLANVFKFQKVKGDGLNGEWKPVYFSGNSSNTSKEWVDLMLRDNAVAGLIQHYSIKEVSKEHRELFKRDVLAETATLAKLDKDPRSIPMSRYACDNPYTCPHQIFCYSNSSLDGAGIYTRKN